MLIKKNPKRSIILVCIMGLVLASNGAYLIYDDNEDLREPKHQQSLLEFRNTIDNRAAMLNRDLDVNFEALRSIAILFRDNKKPSSDEFDKLSESIILRRTTIQALSWIPRVQHSNRAAFEKNTRTTSPIFIFHNAIKVRSQQHQTAQNIFRCATFTRWREMSAPLASILPQMPYVLMH